MSTGDADCNNCLAVGIGQVDEILHLTSQVEASQLDHLSVQDDKHFLMLQALWGPEHLVKK